MGDDALTVSVSRSLCAFVFPGAQKREQSDEGARINNAIHGSFSAALELSDPLLADRRKLEAEEHLAKQCTAAGRSEDGLELVKRSIVAGCSNRGKCS
jgi:hypothetical protein